mmetsp:Transcript_65310/g.112332  ORF Transcript_65310/g.112332 Transcript_65310/m.112332 type:complete len:163 (+) Transcript_65310:244-732(+)
MTIDVDYEVQGFEGTLFPAGSQFVLVERKLPKNEAMENLQKPDWKPHSLDNEEELEFYEWLVVTTDGKELVGGYDELNQKVVPYTGGFDLTADEMFYQTQAEMEELYDPEDFEDDPEEVEDPKVAKEKAEKQKRQEAAAEEEAEFIRKQSNAQSDMGAEKEE